MLLDLTVVIRSAHERTEAVCYALLERQVDPQAIHTIHEVPFSAAVRRAFEIGVKEGRNWTCCVDADVLSAPTGMADLKAYMETRKPETLMVQGLILDKLFGVVRQGGFHFYRTELLEKAMAYLPAEGSTLRPETTLVNTMGAKGYPWVQANLISGVHDYEQYFTDIYRKCFVQAHKHRHLVEKLKDYWRSKAAEDGDFQMALWGLQAGSIFEGEVYINKTQFEEEAKELLVLQGWQEKNQLGPSDFSGEQVSLLIDAYAPTGLLEPLANSFSYQDRIDEYRLGKKKSKESLLFKIGNAVEAVGRKIKKLG